ncbi:DELTA-sagatoxin-Srs1a-like [Sardina pilchardus]|uniref:DELTA-sagatoxin-Srs1a-like n=1 Tax=Sardina pilchardus TaxID=27697 RepID=UPI002E135CE1
MGNTNRQCSIEIENTSEFILTTECYHCISGSCDTPLPPRLSPSESGRGRFIKTPYAACGAVGVFTYDIQEPETQLNSGKIAVMFSNPYDFVEYSNWYGVGVFCTETLCDSELFKKMYYGVEEEFARGKASEPSLTYKGSSVTIEASMSDSNDTVIKVQVNNAKG